MHDTIEKGIAVGFGWREVLPGAAKLNQTLKFRMVNAVG